MSIITLTTDYGLSDSYVAQIKGVILGLSPLSRLIDITHEVPPCDIAAAARILKETVPLFPEATVHLAVVDPGVGGKRKRLIIEAKLQAEFDKTPKTVYLVGPDNGLFSAVAPAEARARAWEITGSAKLPRFQSGETFEGRNIFGPVAGLLALGESPTAFGPEIDAKSGLVDLSLTAAATNVDGVIKGQIVYFDHFGNASTNISRPPLGVGKVLLRLAESSLTLELRRSFEEFEVNQPGCIVNSQGFLEIVVNRGSAREELGLEIGDPTDVSFA